VGAVASALRRGGGRARAHGRGGGGGGSCPLRSLSLARNPLGSDGVALLAQALQERRGKGQLTAVGSCRRPTTSAPLRPVLFLGGECVWVRGRGLTGFRVHVSSVRWHCPARSWICRA
jgi:hypothetical protein